MGLNVSSRGKAELIPADDHFGVVAGYADLGTQESPFGAKRKVRLFFDLPQLRISYEGKDLPKRISNSYTLSIHKKAGLRAIIEAILRRPLTEDESTNFDLDIILGQTCVVEVTHEARKDGTGNYARLAGIRKRRQTDPTFPLEVEPIKYALQAADGTIIEPPASLPPFIIADIKKSLEYVAAHGEPSPAPQQQRPAPSQNVDDEECPF